MYKSFAMQSGKLSDLRKTDEKLCGQMYSKEYIDLLNDNNEDTNNGGYSYIAAHKAEYIAVDENDAGDIIWESAEPSWFKRDTTFHSPWGDFISDDHGEWGGTLITPNETLKGNFCKFFQLGKYVFGIDTCNHMGVGHIKIYKFAENQSAELLYDSCNIGWISPSALTIEPERVLILVTGNKYGKSKMFTDCTPISYLFEITEDGIKQLAQFRQYLEHIYNMILKDDKLILGRDKIITVANITTGETVNYTPLTAEAEEDILRVKEK